MSKDWEWLEVLGEGTFSVVWKARERGGHRRLAAIKVFRKGQDSSASDEIEALRLIRNSPDICQMIGTPFYHEDKHVAVPLEFCRQDFYAWIKDRRRQIAGRRSGNTDVFVPMDICRQMTLQLTSALDYCHERGLLHLDLKPQNVLVARGNNGGRGCPMLKLADFSSALFCTAPTEEPHVSGHTLWSSTRIVKHKDQLSLRDRLMTLWYRSPELCLGSKDICSSIDMWALGCVCAEMITLTPLFPGDCELDQVYKIFQLFGTPSGALWPQVEMLPMFDPELLPQWTKKASFPWHRHGVAFEFGDFIEQLLQLDPSKRLQTKEALCHSWLLPFYNSN
jgi:cyclin-dependent kinase